MTRICLSILRQAAEPLTSRDIALQLLVERALDRNDQRLLRLMYWEHAIRDEADLARHVDYIHYNPVKHGLVSRVIDWPHSTFHQHVARGELPAGWGGDVREVTGTFGER